MSHLTDEQRYTIQVLLKKGISQSEIGDIIGKHRSVISRELQRNKDGRSGEYVSDLAERKYRKRMKEKPKAKRFTPSIKEEADRLLKDDLSPEQIKGVSDKKGVGMVSHETIYQYVWKDKKQGGDLHKHLRNKGKRYRKRGAAKDNRGVIKNQISIDKRPKAVERKDEFGDLEADLVLGKNHKTALVTLNDRSAGMLKMKKIDSKGAKGVKQALVDLVKEWLPFDLRTLTLDNGKEFALHEKFSEETGIDVYFAHPYHSWERGANENLNGTVFPEKNRLFSCFQRADTEGRRQTQ